jgi:hypothetical protein
MSKNNILKLFVIYGIGISLVQFLANRSLWADEAMLALNIIHRSPVELFKHLDYQQSAPPLFLLAEKLFSTVIPNSEYGLRLFPMLCFWMALYLFYRIVRKQQNIYLVCIIALTMFVTSRPFLRYSSEVKQYMTDVFVLLAIFWLTVKDYKKERMKYLMLGISGIIAIYLSNVTLIILATSGLYLCYKQISPCDSFRAAMKRRRNLYPLILVSAGWMVSAVIYYWYFVKGHPVKEFMEQYWSKHCGFLIINPLDEKFVDAIFNMLCSLFSAYFFLCWPFSIPVIWIIISVLSIFYVSGIIRIIKQKRTDLIILYCLPALLHLVMSTLHLYPCAIRLTLYTFPCMIIVCSLGIQHIIEKTKLSKSRWLSHFQIIIPFLILVYTCVKLPIKYIETKACLKYIEKATKNGKANVYLLGIHRFPCKYYIDTGHVSEKINFINHSDLEIKNLMLLNQSWLDNIKTKKYKTDWISNYRGRNWFMLSPAVPANSESIRRKLKSSGYSKLDEYKDYGVAAFLYDCGE